MSTIIALSSVSIAQPLVSSAQDKALAFIENVLPIDCSQYNITLRNYGKLPNSGSVEQESITFMLEAKDSTMDVICTIHEGVLTSCSMYVLTGSVVTDCTYSNQVDAARGFLEKYQAYSTMDSTELINTLSNVDTTKNTTITSDSLKLSINKTDASNTVFADKIHFRWTRVYDKCEYPEFYLSFQNGLLHTMIDQRKIYTIGDNAVNISRDQAVEIALKAVESYSYRMSADWVISDFDVVEDKADAVLLPQTKEGNVLYPAWTVTLPLNGTWPGSVTDLLVTIWAGTGEVDSVYHRAHGGSAFLSDNDSGSELITTTPSPQSSTINETPPNHDAVALITVVILAIAIVTITLTVKKRSR